MRIFTSTVLVRLNHRCGQLQAHRDGGCPTGALRPVPKTSGYEIILCNIASAAVLCVVENRCWGDSDTEKKLRLIFGHENKYE